LLRSEHVEVGATAQLRRLARQGNALECRTKCGSIELCQPFGRKDVDESGGHAGGESPLGVLERKVRLRLLNIASTERVPKPRSHDGNANLTLYRKGERFRLGKGHSGHVSRGRIHSNANGFIVRCRPRCQAGHQVSERDGLLAFGLNHARKRNSVVRGTRQNESHCLAPAPHQNGRVGDGNQLRIVREIGRQNNGVVRVEAIAGAGVEGGDTRTRRALGVGAGGENEDQSGQDASDANWPTRLRRFGARCFWRAPARV
jgi:hypothetical protein